MITVTVNTRKDFLIELKRFLPKEYPIFGTELGVLHGAFSEMILDIIKPMYLILVDPYCLSEDAYESGLTTAYSTNADYETVIKKFEKEIGTGKISVIRKYSYDAINDIPDCTQDFVYIDSNHKYEGVKKDLKDWLPKLKYEGVMCLHDYAHIADFGVIQAVDEFIEENNFEKIIFNTEGGDIALRLKESE